MATRSGIGMVAPDGTVGAIYCHWDGGPEHVGRTLAAHYTSPDKLRELIAGGACSSLGPDIGERHAFADYRPEWCKFYRRDRGDVGGLPVQLQDADAFYAWARASGAQFVYLFNERWRYLETSGATAHTDHALWDDLPTAGSKGAPNAI